MEQRIIGGKGAATAAAGAGRRRPRSRRRSAPLVRNVRIDSGSAGQRLDNFLAKILKGVPRTHLYRVIRSGEVRVNKGRAAADTRLALGDEVRIPPVRVADRSRRARRAGARVPRRPRGRRARLHRQAGRRRRPRRQRRELRRDRADAAGAARARSSSSSTASTRRPRACSSSPRRGRRWSRCRTTCARAARGGRSARPMQRWSSALAGIAQGDRRRAAQGRRSPTAAAMSARSTPTTSAAGARSAWSGWRAALRRLQPARRDPQDRPHAPDPGPSRRCGPCRSSAIRSTATSRSIARSRAASCVPPLRFDRMFLHARRLRFVHPASGEPIELEAPLPAACEALLAALDRTAP